jgi:hypothetical protein
MHRGKKLHMEKFPADVQLAEKLTGGNPDIIKSEEFVPEVRKKWTDLFEDSSAKKAKNKGLFSNINLSISICTSLKCLFLQVGVLQNPRLHQSWALHDQ